MGRRAGEDATQTRARILEAAIDLFSKRGFHSTSISDLAGAIGMTQGVLYWHFKNKEDLLMAAIDELERRLSMELARAASEIASTTAPDVPAIIHSIIERIAALVETAPSYFAFVGIIAAESTGQNPRIEEAVRAAFRRVGRLAESVIKHAIREGGLDPEIDVVCVAQMFIGLYMGAIMHQRLFREELPYERARPVFVELLTASLIGRRATAKRPDEA